MRSYVIFGAGVRESLKTRLNLLLICALPLLALSVLACALARSWWVFDLATHFRPHFLAAGIAAAALALLLRRPRLLALAGLLTLPHLIVVEPWHGLNAAFAKAAPALAEDPVSLRVMSVNVNLANQNRAAVLKEIAERDPDLLFLQEGNYRWYREIAELSRRFPHHVQAGPLDRSGVHLFSRYPVERSHAEQPPGLYDRYLVAEIRIGEETLRAVSLHAPNPLTRPRDSRNRYLRHLEEHLAGLQNDRVLPTIVAGDFNTTRWSPFYGDLIEATGLANVAEERGWRATWPSWLPFGRIAIDHILVSGGIAVRAYQQGRHVESDHLPILADLELLQVFKR